jgi:glucan biosynthesis protein C
MVERMTGAEDTSAGLGREPRLDLLRALVVVGLVFFHSALIFDPHDDYYVKSPVTTEAVTVLAGLAVVWAMPLLFLIAGMGVLHSLGRRSFGGFVRERVRRLFVPLLVGSVTLNALPVWFRLRTDPAYREPYWRFHLRYLDVRLDLADFPFVVQGAHEDATFETGHLWFIVLLLAFSVLLLPVFGWLLRSARGQQALARWAAVGQHPLVLLAVPALLIAAVGVVHELEEGFAAWSRWQYAAFFLCGFLLAGDRRLLAAMRRCGRPALFVGVVLFVASFSLFGYAGDSGADPFVDDDPVSLAFRAGFGVTGWLCVIGIMGMLASRQPARRPHHDGSSAGRWEALGRYANEAVLPFYVLHQPVVVTVGFYVLGWAVHPVAQYAVISLGSLGVTLALYDWVIRRTPVTRLLLGMKPK